MAIGNEGRDLAFYLLLLLPLEFLMTSRRVVKSGNRRTAVLLAGGLLALVSSVKIGFELMHKDPSYYDMMEVIPSASLPEIKKGYKRASLRVHPDKLQAAGEDEEHSDEAFVALKAAYDVLYDSQLRELYDKFGPAGIENKSDTSALLAQLGFFYVIWLAVAYLLTRRKSVNRAQTWSFTGLLALGIFEYQACIMSFDFLEEALPQLAMFEKIELLHRLYPVYLLGARMAAWLIYEDIDTYNMFVLQRLHAKTDMLLLLIRDNYLAATNKKSAPSAAALPAVDDGTSSPWGLSTEALQQHAFRPLHPAMAGQSAANVGKARGRPAPPQKGGGRGISSLLWFFLVYAFFQWLLGRTQ
uniref:J domain-containing protein n=1 Tax=Calcidiscus leptoporus TaxID=127549 RepID=A0A7S0JGW6_9EUKA|mmetsp:Transcript_57942/g.133112  ORF Transcript_57942/g.133112 Transcript_57942/m.133112 type:complete len:356 (+) Transcript_57942:64-1131(+)